MNCSCQSAAGNIDVEDIAFVAQAWLDWQTGGIYDAAADVNCQAGGGCDGVIDLLDVQTVASMWEQACE